MPIAPTRIPAVPDVPVSWIHSRHFAQHQGGPNGVTWSQGRGIRSTVGNLFHYVGRTLNGEVPITSVGQFGPQTTYVKPHTGKGLGKRKKKGLAGRGMKSSKKRAKR